MQLIISSTRYDAFMYASHVLNRTSDVVVLSDGFEEEKDYNSLCREALKVQHRHELDMAYSAFKVRKLYYLCMSYNERDYEKIITEIQLLILLGNYDSLYFCDDGDKLLFDIFENIKRVKNKILYSKNRHILGELATVNVISRAQLARKEIAAERMVTLYTQLFPMLTKKEYTLPIICKGGRE